MNALRSRKMPWARVIAIGLIAGTADILLAYANANLSRSIPFERVLRYIASGVFGKEAFTGPSGMAAWGLFFHYVIAMSWIILIFFLYKWRVFPVKGMLTTAAIYGAIVWACMTFIIVPMTNVPASKGHDPVAMLKAAVILMLAIGIPGVLGAHRYFYRPAVAAIN